MPEVVDPIFPNDFPIAYATPDTLVLGITAGVPQAIRFGGSAEFGGLFNDPILAQGAGVGLAVTNAATVGGYLSVTGRLLTDLAGVFGINAQNAPTTTGAVIYASAVDGVATSVRLHAFANAPSLDLIRANTTGASPSAVASGNSLGHLSVVGHTGSAYTSRRSFLTAVAAENFTGSAQGFHLDLFTTPVGATTPVRRARFHESGNVLIGTITDSGYPLSVNGVMNSKGLAVDMGAHALMGPFRYETAPFAVRMTLPNVPKTNGPDSATPNGHDFTGARDVNRIFVIGDEVTPNRNLANGQFGSLNTLNISHQLGVVGNPRETSWSGNRQLVRMSLSEVNGTSANQDGPHVVAAYPSLNMLWMTARYAFNRGGFAPEGRIAQGSSFMDYKIMVLDAGATNLNNTRFTENGLVIRDGASVRVMPHFSMNIIDIAGQAPVESWKVFTGNKRAGVLSPRGFFALGEQGYGAVDELLGYVLGYRASHANPHPLTNWGIHFRDLTTGSDVMNWPNGRIVGGAHGTTGSGALELGAGRLSPTTTGMSLNAAAYTGKASGYVFTSEVDIVSSDPVVPGQNYSLADDAYNGTYLCYGLDLETNEFTRIEVVNPPVAFGSAPPNQIELRLRHNSSAQQDFLVSGNATTTSHPSKMTHTRPADLIGRYLAYYTGPCAGERQVITGFDPVTRIITTTAFSTVPTAELNAVVNPKFQLPIPVVNTADIFPPSLDPELPDGNGIPDGQEDQDENGRRDDEDTAVNGWYLSFNGGLGTAVRSSAQAHLTGDGTHRTAIQQNLTLGLAGDIILRVRAQGAYYARVGTTRGGDDLLVERFVDKVDTESDSDSLTAVEWLTTDMEFNSKDHTNVWLELSSTKYSGDDNTVKIATVRCANVEEASDIKLNVRAAVEAARLTIDHGTWTLRNRLDLQPGGGTTVIGGKIKSNLHLAPSYDDDAAAAAAGVELGEEYRNGNFKMVRLT